MAVLQPVWNRVDEAQHADFVIQLSHGVYPIADRTLIDPETLRLMQSTGAYGIQGPGTYPTPDVTDMAPPPTDMSARANGAWTARHLWQLSYAAAEPPLYYALMVPLWTVTDRIAGTTAAIYAMRLVNAAIIALLAPMAAFAAGKLAPSHPEVAIGAVVLVALLPGLAFDGTRLSDDALSAVLGGLAVVIAASCIGRVWSWRAALLVGAAMGAGILAKPIVVGIAPAVAVAMLVPAEATTWRSRSMKLTVATLVGLGCVTPWLLFNLQTYGDPIGATRIGHLFSALPLPVTPAFMVVDAAFFVVTFWGGEPLDALPEASAVIAIGVLVAVIAAFGLVLGRRLVARPPLVVYLVAVGGLVTVAFILPGASLASSHGRYLYPGVPAVAALMSSGLFLAVSNHLVRRAILGIYAASAVVAMGSGVVAWVAPVSEPSIGSPPASATVTSVDVDGTAQGFSIRIDRVATDAADRSIWLHVSATNDGFEEIDWTVTPTVTAGPASATADYRRSTKLPGDVDPGHTVDGWIFTPLDPDVTRPGSTLVVRFPDVAPASYRSVTDIVLVVPVST